MKFYIYTLGCKVNAYESEVIKEEFLQSGYELDQESPDVIIVNTCSVTNIADQKSRKMVRRFKKNHNDAILVVCGCSSENNQVSYDEMGVDILIGNVGKNDILHLVENYMKDHEKYQYFTKKRDVSFETMHIDKFTTHTRAFIKIQDGCDNFCSYCIIPYLRKQRRNKDFAEALEEIKTLVSNGHQEVVLTGIHTGSYESEGKDLTDLIHEASKIENLKRIRISSIEVTELNEKFMNELKNNPKICNHMHIPLQAGSDEILKKMNRKYNLQAYKAKIAEIRSIRPDISITTDVIVGHPYETEELFLKTMATCEEIAFSKIHVFPYSIRQNTAASKMPMQVESKEKHRRSKVLCELSDKLEKNYAKKFIGQKMEVLTEQDNIGCTSNYLKVHLNTTVEPNKLLEVEIFDLKENELIGKI